MMAPTMSTSGVVTRPYAKYVLHPNPRSGTQEQDRWECNEGLLVEDTVTCRQRASLLGSSALALLRSFEYGSTEWWSRWSEKGRIYRGDATVWLGLNSVLVISFHVSIFTTTDPPSPRHPHRPAKDQISPLSQEGL